MGVNTDWLSRDETMLSSSKSEGESELEVCLVVSGGILLALMSPILMPYSVVGGGVTSMAVLG